MTNGGSTVDAMRRDVIDDLDAPPVLRHRRAEQRALDAAKRCGEKWGMSRVTVDDIAAEAGMSRATLYRLFPGGKDVLFEALRVRSLDEFFTRLSEHLDGAGSLEEVLVRALVHATRELRADEHLALMIGSAPGEILTEITVEGLPRTVRVAATYLRPYIEPYLDAADTLVLVEVATRLVISYFFAPSEHIDLADEADARRFLSYFLPWASTPTSRD